MERTQSSTAMKKPKNRGLAGLWPPGLRVLLDVRAGRRARWVRYWQWPTTALAGLALAAGALGL